MAKARIQTPTGSTITVEGSPEEVSRLVSLIEGGSLGTATMKAAHTVGKGHKFGGAGGAILELKREGFFNKPRTLADIKNALHARGAIYPLTSLSGIVLRMIRKRLLGRIKENNKWKYVRR